MKRQWSGTIIQSNSISCPRHQTEKELIQSRWHKIKTARAESQDDSSFPVDGHKAIRKVKRQTESGQTLTTRINRNRSTALQASWFIRAPPCFYTPPQKSGGVLCYTLRTILSVCPSIRPSVLRFWTPTWVVFDRFLQTLHWLISGRTGLGLQMG